MYQWSQKTVGATSQTVHTWTPGLCMSHSDVFGKTSQKNISWTKKIDISTYKMHFRVVVAVNLKVLHFAIVISMSHNDFFSKWVFRFAQSQYQSEIKILILTMMTLSILNINKCLQAVQMQNHQSKSPKNPIGDKFSLKSLCDMIVQWSITEYSIELNPSG